MLGLPEPDGAGLSKPTVKQQLAALRMLFDWLVVGHVLELNPAHAVRGPKYSQRKGKTPVLDCEESRALLAAIDTTSLTGLRDRALIGVMIYTFARIGAVLQMNVGDYFSQGGADGCGCMRKGARSMKRHACQSWKRTWMNTSQRRALRPAFLTLKTSPGNYQAWVAVEGGDREFTSRLKRGIGADLWASGSVRMAGTFNFKRKYTADFPTVAIDEVHPGRIVTPAQLESMGLPEAAPEKRQPSASPLRCSNGPGGHARAASARGRPTGQEQRRGECMDGGLDS
jgi:hypothetical protein